MIRDVSTQQEWDEAVAAGDPAAMEQLAAQEGAA